jgi:hypothetical protein
MGARQGETVMWKRWRTRKRDKQAAQRRGNADMLDAMFAADCRRADEIMADDSMPMDERVRTATAIMLAPTRYGRMTRSGMRTDMDCPPHLRAIRKPSGGYFGD